MSIWIKDHDRLFNLRIPNYFKIVYVPIKGLSLFSDRNFKKGESFPLRGKVIITDKSTPEAIQIDERHFLDTHDYVPEDFINHSCNPNTKIDIPKRYFVVMKNIAKNTEITFNYLTTEYDIQSLGADFICHCGYKNYCGHIKGFKYLTLKQKRKLKFHLSLFLLGKLKKRTSPLSK